jgi:hypothetical protein
LASRGGPRPVDAAAQHRIGTVQNALITSHRPRAILRSSATATKTAIAAGRISSEHKLTGRRTQDFSFVYRWQ